MIRKVRGTNHELFINCLSMIFEKTFKGMADFSVSSWQFILSVLIRDLTCCSSLRHEPGPLLTAHR